jgi:hypothetical protein
VSRAPSPTFADRLVEACRYHPEAPADYGQQAWIRRKLRDLGEDVSSTAVSNWFAGYTRARPDLTEKLAQILGRDAAWLRGDETGNATLKAIASGNTATHTGNQSVDVSTVDIPIPLRPGLIVRIEGIPTDMTGTEAQKLANVILAFGTAKD